MAKQKEIIDNPQFKGVEFEGFRNQAGLNAFTLSPSRWIEATNSVGLPDCHPANDGVRERRKQTYIESIKYNAELCSVKKRVQAQSVAL